MASPLPKIVSAQVLAAADRIDRLGAAWRAAGFETGPAVGGTFSIAASPRHFEETFATRLAADGAGGVLAGAGRELPLARLPAALCDGVTLVAFGRPPDFGPGAG